MPDENDRISPGAKKRLETLENEVKELKSAVIALLKGMSSAEKEVDEILMPKGTHYGVSFED